MKEAIVSLLMSEDVLSFDSAPLTYAVTEFANAIAEAYGHGGHYRSGPLALVASPNKVSFSIAGEDGPRQWSIEKFYGRKMSVSPAVVLNDLLTILCLAQTEHIAKMM